MAGFYCVSFLKFLNWTLALHEELNQVGFSYSVRSDTRPVCICASGYGYQCVPPIDYHRPCLDQEIGGTHKMVPRDRIMVLHSMWMGTDLWLAGPLRSWLMAARHTWCVDGLDDARGKISCLLWPMRNRLGWQGLSVWVPVWCMRNRLVLDVALRGADSWLPLKWMVELLFMWAKESVC